MSGYKFSGYDFCGGYDDGSTIFMFVDPEDKSKGFTLSLRDHEGFDDHDELLYEDEGSIPEELRGLVLSELNQVLTVHKDNKDACEALTRCIAAIGM
ncbi:hypothetical protein [Shewanella frigidimarina]|jgi:hypothetical protein|uniref:hypothetical protein n=1 Tax=Shewanella frigidimarina TaxID=56812 RepID=UPI000F5145E1|nr:hypothetical protein [Shewanella frigidimarina]RPA35542.1 hypothetical protein EGC78_04000 [Shewanella frigidimarina]|tara:strand:+ start:140 stop:430 length:291 start_codon:yes stop_codon:yes gene_type:complete